MYKISMEIHSILNLLQVADSAFPTGGFSHSQGLEAFIQHSSFQKLSKDRKSLLHAFVCILENSGSLSLPFVRAAHAAVSGASALDKGILVELDQTCEACTTNHIAKRASTRQGKSWLEVSCFTYQDLPRGLLAAMDNLPHCHLPVVYGAILAGLGLDEAVTLSSFLYCVVRSVVATAVRLDVLGAMEGQRVQFHLQQIIPEIINRNRSRPVEEACLRFPVIDVLQNTQDTLFCKLFYS